MASDHSSVAVCYPDHLHARVDLWYDAGSTHPVFGIKVRGAEGLFDLTFPALEISLE